MRSWFKLRVKLRIEREGERVDARTPSTARICAYTSNALWCTPFGNAGLRHCANRFATTSLRGISLNCWYDWNV